MGSLFSQTGNLHKWMFTSRGCAVLWVHPKHQHYVKPAITANNYESCPWHEEFRTQGTIDNTIFFSVHKAVEYIVSKGGLVSKLIFAQILHSFGSTPRPGTDMVAVVFSKEQFPRKAKSYYMILQGKMIFIKQCCLVVFLFIGYFSFYPNISS